MSRDVTFTSGTLINKQIFRRPESN